MNPSNREVGPLPGMESQPAPEQAESEESREATAAAPEKSGSSVAAPVLSVPQDIPQVQAPVLPDDDSNDAKVQSGPVSEEHHQEMGPWIDKAKEVITRTKDDPFVQKKEISKVKAEFIKNRFNKIIKAEDSA